MDVAWIVWYSHWIFHSAKSFTRLSCVNTGARLPKPEEPDVFFIDEAHRLDLEDPMREYALLSIPMLPLCREDCKGLCPQCGANLNDGPCDCDTEQVDDRLAALKHLLEQPK